MNRPLLSIAAIAVLALSGCVAEAPSPYTAAAQQTLADLDGLDPEQQRAAVLDLAASGESAAWRAFGVDDAAGGPDAAATLIDGALAELTPETEPQVHLASLTSATDAVGSAFGIGFIAIGALGDSAVDASNNGTIGSDATDVPGGQARVTVGADGAVHVEYSASATQGELTMTTTASSDVQPCPDPDGRLELSADVAVRVGLGQAGGSIELHVDATGLLDNDANLAGSNYTYRQQYAAYSQGKGEFLDHSGNAAGEVTVNRYSEAATAEFALGAAEMAAGLAYLVANDLQKAAETGWSSGRCVDLQLTPSEDPGSLEPDAQITIEAAPRSTTDGTQTGGSVTATLSGEGSLDPTGSPLSAPATFDYRAPSEKDRHDTASFESRSNRGIGRATLELSTGSSSYTAKGSRDEFSGSGTICSLTAPFEIPGNTLTFRFTPADDRGGTWRATGAIEDITFLGDGSYTVEHDNRQNFEATALTLTGTITVTGPDGSTYDSPGDIVFALTPTEPCE